MEIMTFNTIFAIIVLAQIFSFTKALPLTDDLSYEYSMDDEPSMSANTGGDYYGYDYSQPEPGKYRCRGVMISIEYKHLCDGNPDCDQLDDEDPVVCRQYIDMPSTTVSPLAPASIETTTTSTAAPTTDEFDIAVFDYSDVVCADDEFQCKADPGVCMPNLVICDGESDCSDGEDETFCAPQLVHPSILPTPRIRNHFEPPTGESSMRGSMKSRGAIESNEHPDSVFRIGQPRHSSPPTNSPPPPPSSAQTVATTLFPNIIKRVLHRATPPPVVQMSEVREVNVEPERLGFEAVHRYIPMPEKSQPPPRRFLGESGETNPDDHEPSLQQLSDEEAEDFMNAALEQETRTLPTTAVSPNALPAKPSVHKAKVRGLMGQLIKQMGRLIATDLENRDIDLDLKISSARPSNGRTLNDEPRMILRLQIEV
uniref:Serine protease nudel n=1 Tax=Phallusia mammillata TaxID=59560 RepID=A0A6F9DJ45_9ASCI|nr:serine protease nudel [Phallusia mammillata]